MKRSGKGSDDAKPFNDFKSLKSEIPDFMVPEAARSAWAKVELVCMLRACSPFLPFDLA